MTGEESACFFAVKEGEQRLELVDAGTRRTEKMCSESTQAACVAPKSRGNVSSCIPSAAGSSAVEVLKCLMLVAAAAGWK